MTNYEKCDVGKYQDKKNQVECKPCAGGHYQNNKGSATCQACPKGKYSNTAILERCFGWSGLLIEANPSNFAELERTRRPRSAKIHSAICRPGRLGRPNTVQFTSKGGPVAGQVDLLTAGHQREWAHANNPSHRVEVPCQPLESLMATNGLAGGATFLSLDVEGAEELVISTVLPSAFAIIMVELD